MSPEFPVRFDSDFRSIQADTAPTAPGILEFIDKRFSQLEPKFREITVQAVTDALAIPDEEIPVIVFDLDEATIDEPFGRRLLSDGGLRDDWAYGLSNILKNDRTEKDIIAENCSKLRRKIALRVAQIRTARELQFVPGGEIEIVNNKQYMAVTNCISLFPMNNPPEKSKQPPQVA